MKAFIPSKLAEVIFALIIAYFGYWHFTHADSMGKGKPDFIPGPGSLWIYITGAGFVLSAIATLTDIKKNAGLLFTGSYVTGLYVYDSYQIF